jgi:hypothetical protein
MNKRHYRSVQWVAAGAICLAPLCARGQTLEPAELIRRVQRQDTAAGEEAQFVMRSSAHPARSAAHWDSPATAGRPELSRRNES